MSSNKRVKNKYEKIFEPVQIGQMKLKNRIVMAPMGTNLASPDGTVNEVVRKYYAERAKGGVGLIIVEGSCWDNVTGEGPDNELRIDSDRYIPGLAQLADTIHQYGAKACIQLAHPGAVNDLSSKPPRIRVAPSAIPAFTGACIPKELTIEEIEELVTKCAFAAKRAKEAGFDGVELHGAHGYLISEFISPLYNKRQDDYGGDLKGRAKFLLKIVQKIKEECGSDYPVIVRLNAEECEEGGIKIKDTKELARLLEDAGVDAIDLSYGTHTSPEPLAVAPSFYPQGVLLKFAEEVKKVVTIPVIGGGLINTPDFAEQALRSERADLVFLGRALLADPEWVNKAASGKEDEIVPCIACLNCIDAMIYQKGMGKVACTVNPSLGKEDEYQILKAPRSKKIIVVGGGPAGMEVSRVAALRGHQVILYDKRKELGGQMLMAGKLPFKYRIADLVKYYADQIEKLGITVKLGEEFRAEAVEQLEPEVIVVATGIKPFIPEIEGIERTFTAEEVFAGASVGDNVAIIGGELVACETAWLLADMGKRVTIMRRGERIATHISPINRAFLLRGLRKRGVRMRTGIQKYEYITDNGVSIINEKGEQELIEADTVIIAAGAIPNRDLLKQLEGKVKELYSIGDCVQPRNIFHAIHEGAAIGRKI